MPPPYINLGASPVKIIPYWGLMILLFLTLMLIPNNQIYGQECLGIEPDIENSVELMSTNCNHPLFNSSPSTYQENYIPDNPFIPLKVINTRLIIIQDDDLVNGNGLQNFEKNNPEHDEFIYGCQSMAHSFLDRFAFRYQTLKRFEMTYLFINSFQKRKMDVVSK